MVLLIQIKFEAQKNQTLNEEMVLFFSRRCRFVKKFFIHILISNYPNLHYYAVLKIFSEYLSNDTHIGGYSEPKQISLSFLKIRQKKFFVKIFLRVPTCTENYSVTGFLSNKSWHCAYIIYWVKTRFKKKKCNDMDCPHHLIF